MSGQELKREQGAPKELSERLIREQKCYALLEELGIEYERIDHAPAMTMEVCREIDRVLEAAICKNLLLCNRQKTAFYLLMLRGDKVFHTKDLSAQIQSSRLSFASPEDMEQLLGCTPGSASVLGLMNDTEGRVRLLIDGDVLESEWIGMHPCINTSSLRIRREDLTERILPEMRHGYTVVRL